MPAADIQHKRGHNPHMAASLLAVIVDCADPSAVARFWATVLSRDVAERNTDEFLVKDPTGASTPLYFMKVPEPKVTKNRLHIDVVTDGPMEDEVQRLVDAGATRVEVRQDPDTLANPDTWTVMVDPEGNEFCVTSTATLTGI
jgi:Glyoxalase-like domain